MRIEAGMLVKTNYNTGPYLVKSVTRGCTCPAYDDWINSGEEDAPDSRPHMHLVCSRPDGKDRFYLGGIDEDTLKSIWIDGDAIEVLPAEAPVQSTMELEAIS